MIRVTLGITATIAGLLGTIAACNTAPNHVLAAVSIALLVGGFLTLAPSEEQEQARVRPLGYRSAHRVRITHGLGECSGFDCRL